MGKALPEGWTEINATEIEGPGPVKPPVDPYAVEPVGLAGMQSPGAAATAARNAGTSSHTPRRYASTDGCPGQPTAITA